MPAWLLMTVLTGWALASIFWTHRAALREDLFLKLFLGAGLGFGVTSCALFGWMAFVSPEPSAWLIDLLLCGGALVGLAYVMHARRWAVVLPPVRPRARRARAVWIERFLALGFYALLPAALLDFVTRTLIQPHGTWDAFAIWNLRARFIFRGGAHWVDGFAENIGSHPDYPLLVPASVTRGWLYAGHETPAAPALAAAFFVFGTVGLLVAAVAAARGRGQGYLAGMLLLSSQYFTQRGAEQYADIPLGFYVLGTVVLFYLYDRLAGRRWGVLVLAGLSAGLAAWTKNEGILFLVVVAAVRLSYAAARKGGRAAACEALRCAAGLLPVLLVVIYFKARYAVANDIIAAQGQSTVEKLLDGARYRVIAGEYFQAFSGWFSENIVTFLLFYLALTAGRVRWRRKAGAVFPLAVCLVMLAGYFFVYVITPQELVWHIHSSLHRLLLHLLPAFLFAFFLVAPTPEEIVS
ncbi:MAG: hypothetical protein JXB47_18300 [Anaerolineae bacterium]|nr:hypothetical protein [Anaerolineae bacterium]